MSARLLILTAGFGEGHNAAARALAAAWDERHGPAAARVVDVFALASPRANALVRRGYLGLINRSPALWRAAYAWLDESTLFPRLLRLFRRDRRVLHELIQQERPLAVACTFPAYAFHLEALAAGGRMTVPFFNIVTDSISINSLWWRAACAGWFLPNADSAAVLRRAGVEAERLHVLGFPVPPFFADQTGRLQPPDLRAGGAPRVLYIVNSGTRNAAETARRLIADPRWELTCTVGRNDALRTELLRLAAGRARPATILGWTSEIPRLLMTHHLVVSKAGGATTQEALAARCPMIVNQIVPGQEEGNYALLHRYGVGGLAETPEDVTATVERAFADGARVLGEWRAALEPLARPAAARHIALALGELALGAGRSLQPATPSPFPPAAHVPLPREAGPLGDASTP